jgi:hypothetical protein
MPAYPSTLSTLNARFPTAYYNFSRYYVLYADDFFSAPFSAVESLIAGVQLLILFRALANRR